MKKFLALLLIAFISFSPAEEQMMESNGTDYDNPDDPYGIKERLKRQQEIKELMMNKTITWIKEHGYWDLLEKTFNTQGFKAAVELCRRVFDRSTCEDLVYNNFLK